MAKVGQEVCSSCGGGAITDGCAGEMLCCQCGMVLKDRLETLSPDWRTFSQAQTDRAGAGIPSSLLIHDTGLSTFIGNSNNVQFASKDVVQGSNTDDSGHHFQEVSNPLSLNRLRRLNAMSLANIRASRNLKKATWEINRVSGCLALSRQVAERSAYFYRKSLQKNLIKGRSIAGFVAAAIYLSCKESMIPRRMDEVCREVVVDRPFAMHCYKILLSEMKVEPPLSDPFRSITKISARAGIEEWVSRKARKILSSVSNHISITGKNPVVLAAAALYLATLECSTNDVTKAMIADAAEVSTISLRKRLVDICIALGRDPI